MRRRIVSLLLILVLVLSPIKINAQKPISLFVNGKKAPESISPFIFNNRTYVPIRFIGESFGMEVEWFSVPDVGMVVQLKDSKGREINIEPNFIYSTEGMIYFVGMSESKTRNQGFIVRNDRTYIPIRYIANALHKDVKWDNDTRTVSLIDSKDNTPIVVSVFSGIDDDIVDTYYSVIWKDGKYTLDDPLKRNFDTIAEYFDFLTHRYIQDEEKEEVIIDFVEAESYLSDLEYFVLHIDRKEILGLSDIEFLYE